MQYTTVVPCCLQSNTGIQDVDSKLLKFTLVTKHNNCWSCLSGQVPMVELQSSSMVLAPGTPSQLPCAWKRILASFLPSSSACHRVPASLNCRISSQLSNYRKVYFSFLLKSFLLPLLLFSRSHEKKAILPVCDTTINKDNK